MRWKTSDLSGWGRALQARSDVARPERAGHLAQLVMESPAPAMGGLRSYGDAALNDGGKVISLERLDRLCGFDPETGILHAESGVTLGALARLFAPRGWLPPVLPGTGYATLGGAIANDVHGKNHHGAGSFGAHVLSVTLARPRGVERVTPVSDPDLFRATMGGLGQTGVIQSAEISMMRAKGDVMIVTERRAPDFDSFVALLDGSEATYAVGWIDATAQGRALGRGILEEGETGAGLVPSPRRAKSVPCDVPRAALSAPLVRGFNAAYFRRVPKSGRTVVRPISDFFFPLDRIRNWNKLYGKAGFHQFQCVVPLEAQAVLRGMLERIAQSRLASPLAVLKRMGPGRAGHLSFPMEGYTLAVDFPNALGAEPLIAELEATAASAGGRIYFAKDALSTGARLDEMYPERAAWAEIVNAADPERLLETDLVRRLGLRAAP